MKRLIIGLIAVAFCADVHAVLLAGTPTNAATSSSVAIGDIGAGPDQPVQQARSITMGATAWMLDSVFFGNSLSLDSGTGGLNISIYSNSGGLPGAVLAQDLFSIAYTGIGGVLTPDSSFMLAANQTYWFVLDADQSGGSTQYFWDMTDSAVFNSDVTGIGFPLVNANDFGGWTSYSGESMQMQVFGAAVPEPATFCFMGVGGLSLYLFREKRRKNRLEEI